MNQIINEYLSGMSASGRPAKQPRTPFGQRMAEAREKAGLRQVQLAGKLGITQPIVAYREREPVALRAEQFTVLADILNVRADVLLGRTSGQLAPKGPPGKLRQAFDKAYQLPRHEQEPDCEVRRSLRRPLRFQGVIKKGDAAANNTVK